MTFLCAGKIPETRINESTLHEVQVRPGARQLDEETQCMREEWALER